MTQLKFARVLSLPGTLAASTVYFVKDATNTGKMEIHVSDATGATALHVPTQSEISNAGMSTGKAIAISMFLGS